MKKLKYFNSNEEGGQIIVVLLLLIVIALAVGLSVLGRSNNEISTATKIEDSAKAFSAAEAGLDKAIAEDRSADVDYTAGLGLTNNSSAKVKVDVIPKPNGSGQNGAYEYGGGISRAIFAQFWLADPETQASSFTGGSFSIYFGKEIPGPQKPAVEVHLIYSDDGVYFDKRYFIDTDNARVDAGNGFSKCDTGRPFSILTNGNVSPSRFYCRATVFTPPIAERIYIMARVKLLYGGELDKHPVAIAPPTGLSFPPQAKIYTSSGTSGLTQRDVQVSRVPNVMPNLFDYVIYTNGKLAK